MNSRIPVLLSAALLLLGGVARGDDDLQDGESVEEAPWSYYPGTAPLDERGEEIWWCVRLVDDVDGRPIPGARVSVPEHPGGGVPESETCFLAEAVSDWEGWARLPQAALEGWMDYSFADAPGYAADEYCTPGETECRLRRGLDVPVVVLDYVGRPVPNARIALNLGCGHVPDQRRAVTDASGRTVLRDILPSRHEDIWIEAPGCHRGTARLRRTWREGDPPVAIDAVPAISVAGRIVTSDGTPVRGALVGASELHRPWTRTDAEGRFRLQGVSPWDVIAYSLPPFFGMTEGNFIAPPEGVERLVVAGRAEPSVEVSVRARGPEAEAAGGVRIALVRDGDGLTVTDHADETGVARLSAPKGRYRVLVDGELGTWGSGQSRVSVVEGPSVEVEVLVPRNPTVVVDVTKVADLRVGVTTPHGFRRVTWTEDDDPHALVVPVPPQGEAKFRISGEEWGELIVAYVDIPAAGESVALDWTPATRLAARLVGPDGTLTPGVLSVSRVRDMDPQSGGPNSDEMAKAAPEPSVQSRLVGTVTWTVTPTDAALAPAHGEARLLSEGGDIDLGEIRLSRRTAPDIRVDLPPDLVLGEESVVSFRDPDLEGYVTAYLRPDGTLDPEDAVLLPPLEGGTVVEVVLDTAEPSLPFRTVPAGPPPWRIAWPSGTLEVEARDMGEAPSTLEGAVLLVDGELLGPAWRDGKPTIVRGIPAGWHTVIVAARGYVAKRYQLRFGEGEARRLRVELTRRKE